MTAKLLARADKNDILALSHLRLSRPRTGASPSAPAGRWRRINGQITRQRIQNPDSTRARIVVDIRRFSIGGSVRVLPRHQRLRRKPQTSSTITMPGSRAAASPTTTTPGSLAPRLSYAKQLHGERLKQQRRRSAERVKQRAVATVQLYAWPRYQHRWRGRHIWRDEDPESESIGAPTTIMTGWNSVSAPRSLAKITPPVEKQSDEHVRPCPAVFSRSAPRVRQQARRASKIECVPDAVHLVAVGKTHPAAAVVAALAAGHRVFGENRVQEAAAKFPRCAGISRPQAAPDRPAADQQGRARRWRRAT